MSATMNGAYPHTAKLIQSFAHNLNRLEGSLYNVDGKIYFGEMTFYAFSGMNNHFTMEFQRMIGGRIQLPEAR